MFDCRSYVSVHCGALEAAHVCARLGRLNCVDESPMGFVVFATIPNNLPHSFGARHNLAFLDDVELTSLFVVLCFLELGLLRRVRRSESPLHRVFDTLREVVCR
jgi:hypothetical protein